MDMDKVVEIIKNTAIQAGGKILEIYSEEELGLTYKKDDSPLTRADIVSNSIILDSIRKQFPTHSILSEEEKDNKSRLANDYVWIIDPLDGTKEFVSRNGEFTVNIALSYRGRPMVSVIYVPVSRELYYAVSGKGAFLERDDEKKLLKVSDTSDFSHMVLVASRSHMSESLKKMITKYPVLDVINKGSSLKGCLVAEGRADAYIRYGPINEWDICAMDLIVHEAGGKMTDKAGNEITYNQSKTLINGFIVSNNKIHEDIIKRVGEFD